MINYGAWSAVPQALSQGLGAFQQAKMAKRQADLDKQKLANEKALADKYASETDLNKRKLAYLYGAPPVPGAPVPDAAPKMTGPFNEPEPVDGIDMNAPVKPTPTPAPVDTTPQAIKDKMALQDNAAKNKKTTAPAAKGFSRGEASLFSKYFSSADSNKISSVPNATSLHNALVDLHQAYSDAKHGDPSRAMAMLKTKAANNDWLRSQLGGIGSNPDNIIPIYNAARRQSGIELFKLSTGSNAAPTEDAIEHNAQQYPDLAMPTAQAQALFNLTKDTQILPAIVGSKHKLQLNRDPKTGAWSSPEAEKLARSLQQMEDNLTVRDLRGGVKDQIVPDGLTPLEAQDHSHLWK